jgi:metal-dependent hydrolase (beta-lactamase superfamily II)
VKKSNKPTGVKINMYNVGFGDSFLVTFSYADRNRRILIDCGTVVGKTKRMTSVVNRILKDSGGHVDAVVVTHRHYDHICAFGLEGPGAKLASLKPEIVIQPWTEHPDATEAALEAPGVFTQGAARRMLALNEAQGFASTLIRKPAHVMAAVGKAERRRIEKIAGLSITNKGALLALATMSPKHAYVYSGSKSGLEKMLPGVKVYVLGPPTLTQSTRIKTQTQWDEAEFWKLRAQGARRSVANIDTVSGASFLFPRARTESVAKAHSYVKWVVKKLDGAQAYNVRRIVRELDDALNNTSVILLFKIGKKALLFPGDAQLENWQFALAQPKFRGLLRGTTVYKVGHHGSTNATPKTLWDLFRYRAEPGGMKSLLSTQKGHHHDVPRPSLVKALKQETDCFSTQDMGRKASLVLEV